MDEVASLEALEQKRKQLRAQLEKLGDFRRGSLSVNYRKCGKANCRCAWAGQRGHGPQYLWTTTVKGQSRARNLRLGPELEKVGREVEAYRRFVQLSQELVEVNEQICDLRPVEEIEEEALDQLKKNCAGSTRQSRGGDSALGRPSAEGMATAGRARFGGGRDGGSLRIIAVIEQPRVIRQILAHLKLGQRRPGPERCSIAQIPRPRPA